MPAARSSLSAATVHQRIGVCDGENHARDARRDKRVGARRRAAVMAARLERHIDRGAGGLRAGGAQRRDFRVRLAGALVPALAD